MHAGVLQAGRSSCYEQCCWRLDRCAGSGKHAQQQLLRSNFRLAADLAAEVTRSMLTSFRRLACQWCSCSCCERAEAADGGSFADLQDEERLSWSRERIASLCCQP